MHEMIKKIEEVCGRPAQYYIIFYYYFNTCSTILRPSADLG